MKEQLAFWGLGWNAEQGRVIGGAAGGLAARTNARICGVNPPCLGVLQAACCVRCARCEGGGRKHPAVSERHPSKLHL